MELGHVVSIPMLDPSDSCHGNTLKNALIDLTDAQYSEMKKLKVSKRKLVFDQATPIKRQPHQLKKELRSLVTMETRPTRLRSQDKASKKETLSHENEMKLRGRIVNGKEPKRGKTERKKWMKQEKTPRVKSVSLQVAKDVEMTGALVWSRFGRRMWPGMLIEGPMVGRVSSAVKTEWVYWFGEGTVSQMDVSSMTPFIATFNQHFDAKYLSKSYDKSVKEAVRECARRAEKSDSMTTHLIQWAAKGFSGAGDVDQPLSGNEFIADSMIARFEKLRKWAEDITTDEDDDEDETEDEEDSSEDEGDAHADDDRPLRSETFKKEKPTWDEVRDGVLSVTDVCISCGDTTNVTHCHPFFIGGHCAACKKDFEESLFLYGSDSISLYCSVCSNAGCMFICSQEACNRVFCHGCIRTLVSDTELDRIARRGNWLCYLCLPNQTDKDSLIQVQEDWRQQLVSIFFKESGISKMPNDLTVKRPLRVLSLFDGIGTGKLVLEQLGFEIDVYYASEINPDCLRLTAVRHDSIKQLGDVTNITASMLAEIAPIDLLIGGSPCQDFSIVNPLRKGLMGDAGLLFFDFYRILTELQSTQGVRPLFWLYENVASMNKETKAVMSRFFKRDPNVWDAINFTAQRRKRFFWGNIPGLGGGEHIDDDDVTELKEVLMPGRKARMSKVRCVTSRSNSLRQSKNNRKQFPVAMGNHLDTLWIPELERLFGFPEHYTDVGNIPVTRRQILLGNSWSVPVVQRLLLPLKTVFATKR